MIEAEKAIREALSRPTLIEREDVRTLLAETDRLTRERNEARAEVEALRAVLEQFSGMEPEYEAGGVYTIAVHGRDLLAARAALAQIEQERSEQAKDAEAR